MGLASAKLLIEAPVNGGRNYNGPKVGIAALVKSGYMLETPRIRWYSFNLAFVKLSSDNPHGADNQQERPIEHDRNPQRLYAGHSHSVNEDIVPSAWRHAGMARQDAVRLSREWEVKIIERNSLSGK